MEVGIGFGLGINSLLSQELYLILSFQMIEEHKVHL